MADEGTALDAHAARPVGTTALALPALGLGCAALGNLYAAVTDEEAHAALQAAWDGGIRYFDTAPYYGHGRSETRLGAFLGEGQAGDALVSTKVGRTLDPVAPGSEPDCGFADPLPFAPRFDYRADAVRAQVDDSRGRLDVNGFAALLLHDIGAMVHGDEHPAVLRTALDEALPVLNDLKAQGITQAVGIGVNEIAVCQELLDHADLDVILLAGRYTLLEQEALDELLPRCIERQVSLVVGGPFNSGLLAAGEHYNYGAVPPAVAARVQRLKTVAGAHRVPLPAAALQFPLAHPAVASVIPGARSAAEVRQNLDWLALPIAPAFWSDLREHDLLHPQAPVPGAP